MLRLRFRALYHLIELGDSTPQAIEVGEPLTADLELTLGPDHPDTLNARNSLAAAYQAAGRSPRRSPCSSRPWSAGNDCSARTIPTPSPRRTISPPPTRTWAGSPRRSCCSADPGRPGAAAGRRSPSTLNSRGNLAAAYRDAGRIDEAIPLFEQTLAARERCWAPTIPTPLPRGTTWPTPTARRAGRPRPSRWSSRSWPRGSGSWAPTTETLAARNNLAAAYRAAGRPAEAIPLFEQNLAACERLLGADHPRTVASRHNLDHARQEANQRRTRAARHGVAEQG